MNRSLASLLIAVLFVPLPCSAHAVVDLAIRFVAPEYVAAGATVPVDVIVDANAYDSADDVTLQIHVSNGFATSADAVWHCTNAIEVIACTAEELKAGPHAVHLAVTAPASSPLQIRATVGTADGFDPREDNNDVSMTSRVFDPAQCTQRAPQVTGEFQWTASSGVLSYDVFSGIDGETLHRLTATTETHPSLRVPGGTIKWYVRAHFDGCPALDSAIAVFESHTPPMRLAAVTVSRDPLVSPQSAAIDGSDVIVSDPAAQKLYTFDATKGTLTPRPLYGDVVTDPPLFDGGIAIGPGPYLYVADRGTHSVRFSDSANYMFFAAGQPRIGGTVDGQGNAARFDSPAAIAVTPDAQIFVSDDVANVVRRVAYNSTKFDFAVTTYAGGAGADIHFNQPSGIAVDGAGNLYVADRGNHVIRRIAANGLVTTIAGIPGIAGHRDADAATALFNAPHGIAIDPWGNLYVTEAGNHDIRKIAPNGRVTTVAGDPHTAGDNDGVGSDAHFTDPALLAVSADGTLWIPDSANGRLIRAAPFDGERRRAARH